MAVRIDALPAVVTPTTAIVVPAVQAGATVKLTVAQILGLAAVGDLASADDAGDVAFSNTVALLPGSPSNVQAAIEAFLGSPAFTGNPTAPTQLTTENSTRLATTAFVQAIAGSLKVFYESTAQTITAAGGLTLAHGLATAPKLIQPHLVNLTAEGGYSIGDKVVINPGHNDPGGSGGRGLAIFFDATNIGIRFNSTATNSIGINHKTTGGNHQIVNTNWNLVIRAWA